MIDPTPNETAAMVEGGKAGGAYLDSLGRTDLALLSEEEWDTFVEVIVTGYCDHLRDLAAKDRERLDGMPRAEINLLALADVPFDTIGEDTQIEPGTVFSRVHGEVLRLAGEHGRTLVLQGLPSRAASTLAPVPLVSPPASN